MKKTEYLEELAGKLTFLEADDIADIMLELESHIDEAMARRGDLSEDEVVARLPPPASVAARYRAEMTGTEVPPADDGARAEGRGRHRREWMHNHSGGWSSFRDMFRFTKGNPQELSGSLDGAVRVDIQAKEADVTIMRGQTLSYRIRGTWDEDEAPTVGMDGSIARFTLGDDVDRLELEVPDGVGELIVDTASGDVAATLPDGTAIAVRSASGDVDVTVSGARAAVTTASGDVSIGGSPTEAAAQSASGDISVHGCRGDAAVATQSGDVSVSLAVEDASVEAATVSGDVAVNLAPGARPAIEARTVSGDIAAPGQHVSKPGFTGCLADGGPGAVKVRTVSGDIAVN